MTDNIILQPNINNDLQSLAQKVHLKKQLEEKVRQLEKQKNSLQANAVQLQLNLEEAQERLEQLDKPGFTNLLITIMGSKESEREYLQKNVDSAAEKRQSVQNEIVKIRNEITGYEAEVKVLAHCESRYVQMIKSAESLTADQAQQYEAIRKTEILGALNAGRKIMKYIDSIENSLGEAKFWSILDVIGGRYAVWADKYNRLDDANVQVANLKTAVLDFKTHMQKVIIYIDYDFSISRLMMAADLMLDSLVTDAMVNRKISQFQFEIGDFKSWMEKLLGQLEDELNKNNI